MAWSNTEHISSKFYQCGYCDSWVANDKGFTRTTQARNEFGKVEQVRRYIYICPGCDQPTYFGPYDSQIPGNRPGNDVQSLPDDLKKLYDEARICCSVGAFTASVLASRKLLMNIAVSKGAKEGLKFIEYVDYLEEHHYTPPNGRDWVDHIRKRGNEATHEIALMSNDDASELVALAEMLLKFIYEFPNRVPKKP